MQLGTVDYQVSRGCHAQICFPIILESNPPLQMAAHLTNAPAPLPTLQLGRCMTLGMQRPLLECDVTKSSQPHRVTPTNLCHSNVTALNLLKVIYYY